jgi:hypothetical protein
VRECVVSIASEYGPKDSLVSEVVNGESHEVLQFRGQLSS